MANENMRLSQAGRAALTHNEAVRRTHYNDQGNNCTLGVGTLVHYGPCTAQEMAAPPLPDAVVRQYMDRGVDRAERLVRHAVRAHELTQAQFDAAVSFVYNTGATRPLRVANTGNLPEVARQMMQYTMVCQHDQRTGRAINGTCRQSGGLLNRRRREAAPFGAIP